MPQLPRSFYEPVAIVFEGHELNAITDAILVYDLLAEGSVAEAVELLDKTDDGGYIDGTMQTLIQVREKIEKARAPYRREIRRWMDQMREWEAAIDNHDDSL